MSSTPNQTELTVYSSRDLFHAPNICFDDWEYSLRILPFYLLGNEAVFFSYRRPNIHRNFSTEIAWKWKKTNKQFEFKPRKCTIGWISRHCSSERIDTEQRRKRQDCETNLNCAFLKCAWFILCYRCIYDGTPVRSQGATTQKIVDICTWQSSMTLKMLLKFFPTCQKQKIIITKSYVHCQSVVRLLCLSKQPSTTQRVTALASCCMASSVKSASFWCNSRGI